VCLTIQHHANRQLAWWDQRQFQTHIGADSLSSKRRNFTAKSNCAIPWMRRPSSRHGWCYMPFYGAKGSISSALTDWRRAALRALFGSIAAGGNVGRKEAPANADYKAELARLNVKFQRYGGVWTQAGSHPAIQKRSGGFADRDGADRQSAAANHDGCRECSACRQRPDLSVCSVRSLLSRRRFFATLHTDSAPPRAVQPRPSFSRALPENERDQVLCSLRTPRFADQNASEFLLHWLAKAPTFARSGLTVNRILAASGAVYRAPVASVLPFRLSEPELLADAPPIRVLVLADITS